MYDWKRHKQGNPEEYQVIRVTEDLEVFCNGELEGKIRMFRNGNFSYFGSASQNFAARPQRGVAGYLHYMVLYDLTIRNVLMISFSKHSF